MSRRNRYMPYDLQSSSTSSNATAIAPQSTSIVSQTNRRSSRQNGKAPQQPAMSPVPGPSAALEPTTMESPFMPTDLDEFNGLEQDSDEELGETDRTRHNTSRVADTNRVDTPNTSPGSSASSSAKPSHHMTGLQLACFNVMVARENLDEDTLALGRKLCSAQGGENQFIACIVAIMAGRQEIRELRQELLQRLDMVQEPRGGRGLPRSHGLVWEPSKELRGVIRLLGCQSILAGDLQAYTATEDRQGDQDTLPLSLYAKVMSAVLSNPSEWKNRLLPPGYGSDPDPASAQSLRTLFNNILKEVRKDFKDIFLMNINLPGRRGTVTTSQANVPVLDTVIVKLYQKERGLVGGRVRVREEILQDVDNGRTARYAWLRLQAIHWGLNREAYNNKSFWDVVDEKLEDSRSRSTRYRYAFFLLILQDDYDLIDGNKNFVELKNHSTFAMPTEQRIQATIEELNETFGEELAPDEAVHEPVEVQATGKGM